MSGSKNLDHLLKSMSPDLRPETYVFATVPAGQPVPDVEAVMQFREKEGMTLILPEADAKAAGLRHEFPCRMITLNIHSSLDAVGFLAVITTKLATLEIGVNPVSAFFHDHLFIPADRAEDVMAALNDLSAQSASNC